MKCSRCGNNLGDPVAGWVNCPKCGLAKFTSEVVEKEEKEVADTPEEEETVGVVGPEAIPPEEKKTQADEPNYQD